ncbi:MAG TPA: cyclic nucleotide-binding domain-containing protein [Verrucomicrobiota bacterium]|nr:cyclic nucleotide-binding domain-containing protein [Verrucomicrobiota bacterium]HNU49308.1 cyclic nucleotide-binding domain-containing protein [Verrucomicrobiota bacterium]
MLERHPFVRELGLQHLPVLEAGAALARFDPGEFLVREGEPAVRFYLLVTGSVALEGLIHGKGPVVFVNLEAGDAVGWSWLTPPYRWHFSARVLAETEALWWTTDRLRALAEEKPEFGLALVSRVTRMAAQRLQATHSQLLDFYGSTG